MWQRQRDLVSHIPMDRRMCCQKNDDSLTRNVGTDVSCPCEDQPLLVNCVWNIEPSRLGFDCLRRFHYRRWPPAIRWGTSYLSTAKSHKLTKSLPWPNAGKEASRIKGEDCHCLCHCLCNSPMPKEFSMIQGWGKIWQGFDWSELSPTDILRIHRSQSDQWITDVGLAQTFSSGNHEIGVWPNLSVMDFSIQSDIWIFANMFNIPHNIRTTIHGVYLT